MGNAPSRPRTPNKVQPVVQHINNSTPCTTASSPKLDSEPLSHDISMDALPPGTLPAGERDLSLWHQACKPFLQDIITYRTQEVIQQLLHDATERKAFILQEFDKQATDRGQNMSFLELKPAVPNVVVKDRTTSSRSSTSSRGSKASQLSNSEDNDVQQSAKLLLAHIDLCSEVLRKLDDRKFSLKASKHYSHVRYLELKAALKDAREPLIHYEEAMETIGCPDLGHRLNKHDQEFQINVLEYLETVQKHHGTKKLRKLLARPPEWNHWHDDYPGLTNATARMTADITQALTDAIKSRDQFVELACEDLEELTLEYAQCNGLQVVDYYQYEGAVLTRRYLETPGKKF